MITPLEDFLNLDIGTSWTKGFLVSSVQESSVKTLLKLPTSAEDLSFSTNLLIGNSRGFGIKKWVLCFKLLICLRALPYMKM